ncbi:uncharacterized protein LOC135358689 [Latimeria chalumnae]|uniref:uncharacterized protein LOC135358689 n=1 Tax=Latimeria chalumnae TaxID=7897 RepID=UPI00313B47DD
MEIFEKLKAFDLSLEKLSAYTADNASVNYGKHNSIYQKLKEAKEDIVAANCLAHIVHNTTKYAAGKLNIDVENVILKTYSHFSVSAMRTEQLKEFCDFVEVEECNLLRHVVTRWLSLLPAINRLLKCWKPLTSYFQSLGEEECPKVIWKCFGDEGTANEVAELYFLFLSHALKLFMDCIEALEAKSFSVLAVDELMNGLNMKLERRIRDKFFGYVVNSKLKDLPQDIAERCGKDFLTFYERAKKYLHDRYDFSEDSLHSKVAKLALGAKPISYEEFSEAVCTCNIKGVDMDELYEELGIVESLVSSPELKECLTSEERYLKIFTKAEGSFKNLKKISSYIFSIPCSNTHTERVFSLMTTAWRNERNRLDVDSVKGELQICVNLTGECKDMYSEFLKNKKLLKAARDGQKYRVRHT